VHIEPLDAKRHAQDLRNTWQAQVLFATDKTILGMVVQSVLAHHFDDALPTLFRLFWPEWTSISAPFLCSAAKIAKNGVIVADAVMANGTIVKDFGLFQNETGLRDTFRYLSDRLKLSDDDRRELFWCVQKWVVADRRLDPAMDARDPDAKRLKAI